MNRGLGAMVTTAALLWLSPITAAHAERVLVVPHSQKNTSLPHPVYEGARVTLKATLRDAECGSYDVWWDADRDGDFADEPSRRVSRHGSTRAVADLGRTFLVPSVERNTSLNVNVRVRSTCTGEDLFSTFRMFVYDFALSADPRDWTAEQVEIARDHTLKETMWYLHRAQTSGSGYNVSTLHARAPDWRATGLSLWLLTVNGHLPAYPPGTINAHGRPLPDGWAAANDERWHADPYAETAMRFANYLINGRARTLGVEAGDESNQCGYNGDGSPRICNRIPGTTDNRGAIAVHHNVYYQGMNLGSLATVLPALAGTPLQLGQNGVRGQTWEWYIQQAVDYLGYEQIDAGCSGGGWYYYRASGSRHCGYSDGSTSQWAYIGLESAEVAGGPYGVIVNNLHKYRIVNNLINNQNGDGGSGYRNSSGRSAFQLTGGAFVAARWLGAHQFASNDNAVAFPGTPAYDSRGRARAPHTRGELRRSYDRYLAYTARYWSAANLHRNHSRGGWISGLWQNGDHLCGDTNGVDNQGRCGNTYAIYSHQKGYRTGTPELDAVGGNDWFRQFSTYYIRAQERSLDVNNPQYGYGTFGRINDGWCGGVSVTCRWGRHYLNTAMAGLVLTPTIFNPKPLAIGTAVPAQVTEGCAGGNNGRVTFDHSDSFHPNASGRIVAYQWDFDDSNGLWWDTGADPDFVAPGDGPETVTHTYSRRGPYTATLRVVDHVGQTGEMDLDIDVRAAQNVPPSATHGGPYVLEIGGALALRGGATDGNTGCGDTLALEWDLDGDDVYDDAEGATPTVPWQQLQGLEVGRPHPVRFRATDSLGERVTAATTLSIYPRDPVADGRANPNPAGCNQQVTFDGSASHHPNPARSVAQYEWNVDNRDGYEGGGGLFRYNYRQFGSYDVTLRVTDDLGRTASDTFRVEVNQGNRPPVARTSRERYVVLEGDDLTLDGRLSSDPDADCGDRIEAFDWDVNGDAAFGGEHDVQGAQPTIAWDDLVAALNWQGGQQQIGQGGEEDLVTLRVTDSFGATHTHQVRVVIFPARPRARITQSPTPAPINLVTGFSNPTLDGRESLSPIPNGQIVRHDWDTDNDGDIDIENQAVIELVRVFQPVPTPDNLPDVEVRLVVTDADGRTAERVHTVVYRVPPTPPHADADPSDPPERGYHILAGDGVTLDASQAMDPDAEDFGDFITAYRWDLSYDVDDGFQVEEERTDEDGDAEEARAQISAERLAELGIDGPGEFAVALQVEDTTRLVNQDTTTLTVHPRSPSASIDIRPNPAAPGERLTIDGGGSEHSHPEVDVVSWTWDLDGDGAFGDAVGRNVSHSFSRFTFGEPNRIGLRVTDSNGNVGETVIEVPVNRGNRPPVASAGGHRDGDGEVDGPYVLVVGDALQLDAAGSLDPDASAGDDIVRYRWDLRNDGSFEFQGARPGALSWNQLVGLGIDRPGQYDVRLEVTDRFGVTAESIATVRVVVGPTARAVANPFRTGCERQVEFDGSQSSSDAPAELGFAIIRYEWDLDLDGAFDDATGPRFTRPVVALPGEDGVIRFPASLRVTDASGHTDTDAIEVIIDVDNLRPVADAGGPYVTGPVGNGFAPVRLDGRGSLDPNAPCDRITLWKWDTDSDGLFGRDDVPADREGVLIEGFVSPGWQVGLVQTIGVVVCDAAGACSEPAEADIEVGAEAPPAGELIGPRAGEDTCVGAGARDVVIEVADPEGDRVTATIVVGGVEVAQRAVQTNVDGSAQRVELSINANLVPEGRHEIEVLLDDGNGGNARVTSGGRVPFDRTGPQISIGDGLREGVCYGVDQVPQPEIELEDNLDDTPTLAQQVQADGCGRTLRVTATDACGNESVATRGYLTAQRLEADIDGAESGELVATAEMSWEIDGPASCASNVIAELSRDGADPQPYVAGTPIEAPGSYVLTVSVANCQGVRREQLHPFTVNAPPVAVAVPADHPARDPDVADAYLVDEGDGLQLDGSQSRSPEEADHIALYEWDFEGDGVYDAQGEVVAFPTSTNRAFVGRLRVTDSLGATATAPFRVTVRDVDPTANPGGPYVVDQGEELVLDGRGSRAGSAADPIGLFAWDVDGDGDEDAQGAQVAHTYVDNGVFNATLRVRDEDSEDTATVRVEVRDVDPVIQSITSPQDTHEIVAMSFSVSAIAGAPGDPLARIEWDFDGDGHPEYAGVGLTSVRHVFRDAGEHTVAVRVFDNDSTSTHAINVAVREITLAELITHIGGVADTALADQALSLQARLPLNGFDAFVDNGLWGERRDQRGNTLVAVDKMVSRMVQAQRRGADFGLELWAMGRQLSRASHTLDSAVRDLEGGPGDEHPSVVRARDRIEELDARYESDAFEDDAHSNARAQTVQELWADAFDSYYFLRDATGPFADGFRVPEAGDGVERSAAAQEANDGMVEALRQVAAEMQDYVDAGAAAGDEGPGRDAIQDAISALAAIREMQAYEITNPCPEGHRCVTDEEATQLLLTGIDMANALIAASQHGAYTRNWQHALVEMLAFRTELSLLRVEWACGVNSFVAQIARATQDPGMSFVDEGEDAAALSYYVDPERRCLILQTYNDCLVTQFPEVNPRAEYPDVCIDVLALE